jgi:hypothetical protein
MTDRNGTVVDAETVVADRTARRAYHSPTLADYGQVRELTHTSIAVMGPFDGVFYLSAD